MNTQLGMKLAADRFVRSLHIPLEVIVDATLGGRAALLTAAAEL
jgi:hypothetical protein